MTHTAKTTAKTVLAVLFLALAAAGLLLHANVPQVPSNTWAPAGDMASIRAGASGTLLPNGLVLVAGGIDANGATSSVERFSPSGGGFLETPAMQLPRANHTATLLADGRVLVAGGSGASGVADATAELYDPAANMWVPAGSLNVARRGHTATRLADGKVLIAGGDDGGQAIDSLEIFDPVAGLFTVVDAASSGARTLHAAAALLDGRVLTAGGYDGTTPLASTSLYDPETGTVSAGPDLSTPRSGLTATTLLDGRVLVTGGAGPSGELASAEIFDPATNAFTATDNTLSAARQNHLAFLLPHNNQVLIVGGLAGGNPVAAAEYFTPWEGTSGSFCADAICASGYAGPAAPATARAWATGSALSFPADKTIRTGPNDGLLVLAGGSGQQSAELFGFATIRTDKVDYAPGETVTITGSGWQPHEWVALRLLESPLLDEHPLLDVEADDNGNITSTEFVPDNHDANVNFYATAFGAASQAQTTFSDSPKLGSVSVGAQSGTLTAGTGGSVTFPITVNRGSGPGSSGSFTATLSITTALPLGAVASFAPNPVSFAAADASKSVTLTVTTTNATSSGTTSFTVKAATSASDFASDSSGSLVVGAGNTTPTADPKSVSTDEDVPLGITLTGSDSESCDLSFSIVTPPATGSLGSISNNACVAGSPNTDSASVTFTPAANFNGSDSFTYRVSDGSLNSAAATVSITINSVNDVPSFTKGANQTVLEDAGAQTVVGWATAISNGPADESGQTVNFIVSNDNNGLFSGQPSLAANGTLTYTPAANANGLATVSAQIHDSGGTTNGGVDTSVAQTFTITVTAVNDAPSFTKGADQTVGEDAGAQSVPGWATAISAGPADEAGQTVDFAIDSNSNTALFSVQPGVSSGGTLTYTPAANANGSATITLHLHDDGGTANGGANTSGTQSFAINVTAVNDAPSFTKGADQTVLEDSGAHTVAGWATAISAGPADESGQLVDFVIDTNNNAALFSVPPAVSPTGTLTFTSAPDANGSATITLHIHDNGGIANSGIDSSATQSFTITVTDVNDAPGFTKGADQTVLEDSGAASVPLWATSISAGPNESQTVDFMINSNSNTGLFAVQPAVSPGGTLSFTPASNANGSATITLHIHDDGGTANGGLDASATQSFVINVTAVNDAPAFTKGADQTVLEDAGAKIVNGWATAISAGPSDESSQAVNFIVSNNNNSLFSSQPVVDATGKLTYTPAANAFGSATVSVSLHDDGGTTNSGVDTSAIQTFTIDVTPVNDEPAFTKGADQTVNEDAGAQSVSSWATAISAGPNEGSQIVDFLMSNNDNGLFSAQPAVAGDGTLTYTPAPNANGSATVTVRIHDDGGTANGGVDTSAAQTFTITVRAVNDAPSFTKGADQTVLEDAGAQSIAGWATTISAGPADELGQALDFIVSNNNNALFSSQPTAAANGTLTYTAAANAFGSATVSVSLHDDGGIANGGVDTSAIQTFTIDVTAVNDAPSFTEGADQTVLEDAGGQSVPGWATAISAGPANESGQALNFIVSNNNNGLFSTQPAVAADGTLSYTPASNANGSATVTVQIHDDGGTANSGVDTSAAQTFTISVTAVNDAPSFTKGADQSVGEDSGAHTVTAWATGVSAGPPNESGQLVDFVIESNSNSALFSAQPAVDASGNLSYTPAANLNGSATITLHIHDNGGTANGGVDSSLTQSFTITVTAVNDAPSFTKGADQTVLEDSGAQSVPGWATAISPGPADEVGQTVDFVIDSNTNTALFSVQPTASAAGALTYTPAPNANGSATITLHIHDDGGTAGGGADSSGAQSFTINVTAVNDVPSFTKGSDQTVLEDAGAQSVSNWASAITAGPADESGQALNFIVSNNNNALFSSQPSVAANGTLTYTPATNANGSATVTLQIHDSGGTANGGIDTSATQVFAITVTAVNDTPSFTKGANQTVIVNSGAHTVTPWATAISAGPPDEAGQALNFLVSNDNNALFSVQPMVAPDGTLTFTPTVNAVGVANVSIQLHDNGGGADTSVAQTFTITVLYSTGSCLGEAGHQILQPINADGTSVSKRNSTVPAKFRVCDATGHSIGTPGVVSDFRIVSVINGTVVQAANEIPDSTTPDTAFRWSPTDQLWIYNINTKDSFFQTNRTYVFNITLGDGSIIPFQFGLK